MTGGTFKMEKEGKACCSSSKSIDLLPVLKSFLAKQRLLWSLGSVQFLSLPAWGTLLAATPYLLVRSVNIMQAL